MGTIYEVTLSSQPKTEHKFKRINNVFIIFIIIIKLVNNFPLIKNNIINTKQNMFNVD